MTLKIVIMDSIGKKEPALFTQRLWFESLCIHACVMKFFCPVVMANVINACKR